MRRLCSNERTDGKRQIVLIEWKYGESYSGGKGKKFAKSGKDRTTIYQWLYDQADCPINKHKVPHFDDLFYEPFYQLLRQQLLAREMEKERELGADFVSLLHIAPACNEDFRRVTSPRLQALGETAMQVWQSLVPPDKFKSVTTEALFGYLTSADFHHLRSWLAYIHHRYEWVIKQPVMLNT
jgi:hypothetical protein